jgi:hypothetical protein
MGVSRHVIEESLIEEQLANTDKAILTHLNILDKPK